MQENEQSTQVPPNALKVEMEELRPLLAEFRASYRVSLDDSKKSIDMASEANKQIASFYERLMLIDFGIIGFSVTALTTSFLRFPSSGYRKYIAVVIASAAWMFLLNSSFNCRSVMLKCIKANKSFLVEWRSLISDFERQFLSSIVSRMSKHVSGSVSVGTSSIDIGDIFLPIAKLVNAETLLENWTRFQKALASEEAEASLATSSDAVRAIKSMQLGLVLLIILAIFIFLSI